MTFNLQPHLKNESIELKPLGAGDFEKLFAVASDPLIWEQHPERLRYTQEVFKPFFDIAMESKSAFLIYDATNNTLIGSTRYYDYNPEAQSIAIGYTFLARSHWGNTYNKALKKLMIDYAFEHFETVVFHVGPENWRSRKAVEKLSAELVEAVSDKVTYHLSKKVWQLKQITIVKTHSDNADFVALVHALDAYLKITDGVDNAFYAQYNKLDSIKYVLVAYHNDVAIGCGAIKQFDAETIEVKRMYVVENYRGIGLASLILKELENWAKELGFKRCILETGRRQTEALLLYPKNGYTVIPNYGQYEFAENSVCFEKQLIFSYQG